MRAAPGNIDSRFLNEMLASMITGSSHQARLSQPSPSIAYGSVNASASLHAGGIPPGISQQVSLPSQPMASLRAAQDHQQAHRLQLALLAAMTQQQQQQQSSVDINSLLRQALGVPTQAFQAAALTPPSAPNSSALNRAQILYALGDPVAILRLLQFQQNERAPAPAPPVPPSQLALSPSEIDRQHHLQTLRQSLVALVSREIMLRGGVAENSPSPKISGQAASSRSSVASPLPQKSSLAPPTAPQSLGISMSLAIDNEHLSEYQILVRQQLELFVAKQEEVDSNTQGRKRQVFLGQAGIRCKHCAHLPLRQRGRGAVYYPAKLTGMYQAAQNMASSHLSESCPRIPMDVKQRLLDLRGRRDTASGGKHYWADAGRAIGLYEADGGLRIR